MKLIICQYIGITKRKRIHFFGQQLIGAAVILSFFFSTLWIHQELKPLSHLLSSRIRDKHGREISKLSFDVHLNRRLTTHHPSPLPLLIPPTQLQSAKGVRANRPYSSRNWNSVKHGVNAMACRISLNFSLDFFSHWTLRLEGYT